MDSRAAPLIEREITILEALGDKKNLTVSYGNMAHIQFIIGALHAAASNFRRSIELSKENQEERDEASVHEALGHLLSYCGAWDEVDKELTKSWELALNQEATQGQSLIWSDRAECVLLMARDPVKLKNGDTIVIGDDTFEVIHTPGHTPGSICLYSKVSKSLFSGDTIFSYGSFGRYDFPEGDFNQLKNSIEKIAKLDILNIYPGHEIIVEGDGNKHMKMTLQNIRSLF